MTTRATSRNNAESLQYPPSPLGEAAEVLGHRYLDLLEGVTRELSGREEEAGALTLTERITGFHRDLEGLLQLSSRFSRHPIVHLLITECLEVREEFSGFLQDLHQMFETAHSGNHLETGKRDLWQRNQRLSAKLDLVFHLAERLDLIGSPVSEAA